MLLKNIRYLVTQDSSRSVLENVDVRVEGNRIAAIGEGLLQQADEETLDCSRRIVMPGLINAHCHLGMTGLRGLSDDRQLHEWLQEVFAAESALHDEDLLAGNSLGIKEALRTGTTAVLDMFYRMHLAGETAQHHGLRLLGAQTFLHGHPLSANDTVLPQASGLVRFCFGPHAIYTTDEATLKRIRLEATAQGVPIHIHVAETRRERAECKRRTGMLPVEYLEQIGFLGPDVIVAHANWLTKGELDILARRGVNVVHCPQSNMKLAGGSAMPLREMQERGITVALGTDSAVSNNSLDMFREMHVCALLHKHHYWNAAAADAQAVLDMATINGAIALGIDAGAIEAGKLADLITLDLDDPNLQPIDKGRVVSHLVYAASGMNVSEVIVDGRLVVNGKKIIYCV